jgi:hypothetical protein
VAVPGSQLEVALVPSGKLTLRRAGGELVFEYSISKSGTFQLQATDTLVNPAWQTVAVQEANGSSATFRIPNPAESPQFYRVVGP